MLNHPRMKTAGFTLDKLAVRVETLVANVLVAIHYTTQARDGQTAFPTLFQGLLQRRDQRIEQDGLGTASASG
jgi:hypothetical protein